VFGLSITVRKVQILDYLRFIHYSILQNINQSYQGKILNSLDTKKLIIQR